MTRPNRMITRADFDGTACLALLHAADMAPEAMFVHPKDVQDGRYLAQPGDTVCNLPYMEGCGLWFCRHGSELARLGTPPGTPGRFDPDAPSTARLVFEHLGGKAAFGPSLAAMVDAVDRFETGRMTLAEIRHPSGWFLLGTLLDPRTGLGRHPGFALAHQVFVERVARQCAAMGVEELLAQPDAAERSERLALQSRFFERMLRERSLTRGPVGVVDLRGLSDIPPGSRFAPHALHQGCNAFIHIIPGHVGHTTVLAGCRSALNPTCRADIGVIMHAHGGGGHAMAGSCQVGTETTERALDQIIEALSA